MIYELRRYEVESGKMQVLQNMMEHMAVPVFKKYGMHFVGAWTITIGDRENTLVYMLAYESMDVRTKSWAAFHKDPGWLKDKNDTYKKEGQLVTKQTSCFLTPEVYSPLK